MATAISALAMLAMAAAAWGALGWLIVTVPPTESLAIAAFYVFAFVGISDSAALLACVAVRPRFRDGSLQTPARFIGHAMLLATIVLFALWLQSLRMLTATSATLLVALYVFLELALLFGTRGSVDLEVESRAFAPER